MDLVLKFKKVNKRASKKEQERERIKSYSDKCVYGYGNKLAVKQKHTV